MSYPFGPITFLHVNHAYAKKSPFEKHKASTIGVVWLAEDKEPFRKVTKNPSMGPEDGASQIYKD